MSAAIDALKKLLACEVKDGSSASHAHVEERDPSAKLRRVTLEGLNSGVLAFSLEKGKLKLKGGKEQSTSGCLSPIFVQTAGAPHHKSCDLVVLRAVPNEKNEQMLNIVYFEMKSGRNANGATLQFASSHCFMNYVNSVLRHMYKIETIMGTERYVLLCGERRSISKTATRFKPHEPQSSTPTNPEPCHVSNDISLKINKWLK